MSRRLAALLSSFLVGFAVATADAQAIGTPPVPDLGFHDVAQTFALPPLKDQPNGALEPFVAGLQVINRARRLGLDGTSAVRAWRGAAARLAAARSVVDRARNASDPAEVRFDGGAASALNRLLRAAPVPHVRLTAKRLMMDEPLRVDRAGARLDLGRTQLIGGDPREPYMLRIEGAKGGVIVLGGVFTGQGAAVLVADSVAVVLANGRYENLVGNGVVVTQARDVLVWGNRFARLGRAAVLLHGATTSSVVADNDIEDDVGSSNWHAGVVVTDRNVDLARDPSNLFESGGYWAPPEPITGRLSTPRGNVVALNRIVGNKASGVYFDGAVENVVVGNTIEGNAKEGMCLDNGSTANVVALNSIAQNGKRWGSSDADLQRDFVAAFGRLPDGSAAAKVPGLSLDNAAYNLVYGNMIGGNFGGGIKMVRTGFFNTIGLNTIVDNNEGASLKFHFFGVELGAAGADAPAVDLNFTPSRGNIIFSNLIRGGHYAGVFFAAGSDTNDLFDNTIFGATRWAVESATKQNNATLNNLTNLHSRNASPGLDPRLPALAAGQFD